MRRLAFMAGVVTVLAAACGIGGDGDLEQIGADDLVGLDQTTTTTTTTTTVAPTATPPAASTTSAATTTTIATEPVELYYVSGSQLEPVTQELSSEASLDRVLLALETGPPRGDIGIGLTNDVPFGLVSRASDPRTGVAEVDVDSELYDLIPGGVEQRRAIGQIVLTLTKQDGIGQVSFTLDGEPLAVPKQGNVLSEPGEPVARIDYESLLRESDVTEVPSTSTTSTTSTTTPRRPDRTDPPSRPDG